MSIPSDLRPVEMPPVLLAGPSRRPAEADPHETFLRNKNFASLNGVRCLCCLVVIKYHMFWDVPMPRLFAMGFLAVDLFFVISGFLIVTLLIRERERRGTIGLGKFYARRSLRIFPIYYLLIFAVLAFYLAISPWRPNGLRFYAWTFPVLLTYTQDFIRAPLGIFYHCWSLAVEEQFYQFWPTVEKYATRAARWGILAAMLAANQVLNFGGFDGLITRIYGDPEATKLPIFLITFTPILLGVLLAYLLDDRRSFGWLRRAIGHRWSPVVLLGVLFATCEAIGELDRAWPKLAVHVLFMLLIGSLVIREDHVARPFLTLGPIARMGVISYGLYLYHILVFQLVNAAASRAHLGALEKPAVLVAGTAATIAVAEASFRWVEQPLLRLKERFHS